MHPSSTSAAVMHRTGYTCYYLRRSLHILAIWHKKMKCNWKFVKFLFLIIYFFWQVTMSTHLHLNSLVFYCMPMTLPLSLKGPWNKLHFHTFNVTPTHSQNKNISSLAFCKGHIALIPALVNRKMLYEEQKHSFRGISQGWLHILKQK